jgi:simple sugar transport system ATP-binding protein
VRDLPVGIQQRVEILKALYHQADVLILDEPTAVLTPQETDQLFEVLGSLTAKGMAIIFITHKLREVFAVASRIVILRHGRVVATTTPPETDQAGLATLMVGRPVELHVVKHAANPREVVLEVKRLRVQDDRGTFRVDGLDLEVRSGEVLGIAGVEGNGQTELVEALTGLRRPVSGSIQLNGHAIGGKPPHTIIVSGVAHIPEDRHKFGLVLDYSVADNLVLSRHDQPPFARGAWLVFRAILDEARRLIKAFDIRTPSPQVKISTLSGGNQQKTVIARELSRPVRLVVAAQPTRGLDVGSTESVHQRLLAARDTGSAVVLVSAELDEILALADRIAVLYRGRVVATIPSSDADRGRIGLLMAGGSVVEAVPTLPR